MSSKIESSKPPSLITLLPNDIVPEILARVPRCKYPTLSLVSKHFQSLVVSPEIYARRSLLRCTENFRYVLPFTTSSRTPKDHWRILRRKSNGNRRFVPISALSDLPSSESFVAVGFRIYVFGRKDTTTSSSAFSIDCRHHTMQPLPNMPIPMSRADAAFLDGKIYVFGYSSMKSKLMVVFDTETQMWEPGLIKPDIAPVELWEFCCVLVMADKIYMRYNLNSYVYVPKESRWETDKMLNFKDWDANTPCVVDDVLYYYEWYENRLRMYDPKQKCWGVVKGLEDLLADGRGRPYWADTACFGRKLAFSFKRKEEISCTEMMIWCAEISLERRQGGGIWGKVEWCDQVMVADYSDFTKSLSVMV